MSRESPLKSEDLLRALHQVWCNFREVPSVPTWASLPGHLSGPICYYLLPGSDCSRECLSVLLAALLRRVLQPSVEGAHSRDQGHVCGRTWRCSNEATVGRASPHSGTVLMHSFTAIDCTVSREHQYRSPVSRGARRQAFSRQGLIHAAGQDSPPNRRLKRAGASWRRTHTYKAQSEAGR